TERAALRTILDTEQERYRIGMDLHDGVMQDVYAVALGLELVLTDVEEDPQKAEAGTTRAIDQLHDVIRDLPGFIFDLRPRQCTGDILASLKELGLEFQENSGIRTEVKVIEELPPHSPDIDLAFYLITHEALSNIRKHARAALVTISLQVKEDSLRLQ